MSSLLLLLVGAVVALDATTLGQTMVSRPLVAGVLAGSALGDPGLGLGLGALFELFSLVALPSGGSRLDEMGLAAVVAVGAVLAFPEPGRIPLGVAWGLLASGIGGSSVHRLRVWNGRRWAQAAASGLTAGRVSRTHLGGLLLDALRGIVVVGVMVPLGRFVLTPLAPAWPLDAPTTRTMLLVAVALHAGVLLQNWGGWQLRRVGFLAGIVAGLAIGLFT